MEPVVAPTGKKQRPELETEMPAQLVVLQHLESAGQGPGTRQSG